MDSSTKESLYAVLNLIDYRLIFSKSSFMYPILSPLCIRNFNVIIFTLIKYIAMLMI